MRFDVVIVGYRLNAKEPAPKAMERILGLDAETARRLARNFPATVRAGLDLDKAENLKEDLTEAGALVELHAEKPTGLHKKVEPAPEPPTSPGGGRSLPTGSNDKVSLDFAPRSASRTSQRSDQHRPAPPPPPAEALANYQLGDFGLAGMKSGGSMRPGAPLAVPAPPAPGPGLLGLPTSGLTPRTAAGRRASLGSGMDLDFDGASDLPLELDQPADLFAGRGSRASPTRASAVRGSVPAEPHMLAERFSDESLARAPQVEERAYKSIQRSPRSLDSRRPGRQSRAPASFSTRLLQAVRDWAPSTLFLVALSVGSLLAVGYALDPDDMLGALVLEHASAFAAPHRESPERDGDLHPLLRATPAATRPALAAVLRARIPGVHEVALDPQTGRADLHCAVVENVEGQTETRLAQLRATGREVAVPAFIGPQLREREKFVREASARPELSFTEVCLTL
ncbi:MAG: hypothetical protein JWN48_2176 [Myxococcaceae bacterium]|nr:hypothetical protein [Myxococcaceae bacterium]